MAPKIVIPPINGWQAETYYAVDVKFTPGNPVHRSILAVGFLTDEGEPGGYSFLMNRTYEEMVDYNRTPIYHLKSVRKLRV